MRTLEDRRYEEERANADDRDLRSRTDAKHERVSEENALMALAKRLVELKDKQLQRLALPEDVLEAVVFARTIRSAPAHTRQLRLIRQHLRRLGRHAIEARLNDAPPARASTPAANASGETSSAAAAWLERLLSEGDAALVDLLQQYPNADRQVLRQQMRTVVKGSRPAEARLRDMLSELVEAG
jgi:ribosome-associated protein